MAYLDHAATTPMSEAAIAATDAAFRVLGNASSLHTSGRNARRLVEEAREQIARALGALPGEVVFTSGGTEANNLAIKGLYWTRRAEDARRTRVITLPIEHHAVLDAVDWLGTHEGAQIDEVPVDANGVLDLAAFRSLIEHDPASIALITVMWANNEVGTVQPIADVAAIAKEHGIPVHSDAVQAVGALPVEFDATGLAALTLSGHKLGGPIGVGALLLGREYKPTPVLHGGGQERDVRSGTLAMPLIAGLGVAVQNAVANREVDSARIIELRERLIAGVEALGLEATLRGHRHERLPGNAHFTFAGCEGDALLMLLDARDVQVSTGSACTAGIPQPSHVLLSMGLDAATARGALRFSLGRSSVDADVDALLDALPDVVARARRAGLVKR